MAEVIFNKLEKVYSNGFKAVHAIDLKIAEGEFMVIVGPSGCAKSTTLRMLAGLETISGGEVRIGEKIVNNLAPKERGIAMVFQNYALYPHMTVRENLAFGLKLSKLPKAQIEAQVNEAAKILELDELLDRLPRQLSGGQAQRVAVGRAIVKKPDVFLFDEPLSNLDAKLRVQTRTQIAALQSRLGVTTVYVTHDQVEAMTMGDRVAVMKDGVLQQVDTPLALYDTPKNLFVAGFIGSPAMNLISGKRVEDGVQIGDYVVRVPRETLAKAANGEDTLTIGIRPEAFRVADEGIGLHIAVVEELGADSFLYGTLASSPEDEIVSEQQFVARVGARTAPHKGEVVRLAAAPEAVHVFSNKTEERLS